MKGRTLTIVSCLFLLPFGLLAQSAYQEIREGNKAYNQNKYDISENLFRKSLQKDPAPVESAYNLGNALYRQGKYEDAARYFNMAADKSKDKDVKSNAYQNLGNSLLKSKKLEESIKAYKNSLIQQPNNADSRYNLAYANRMLQKQKQQQKKDQKQDKKKQDQKQDQDKKKQDQDKQDQDKKQDEKDKEQQDQKKEDQEKQDQQQQQQQKKEEISRDDAKRMLEAVNQKEKAVQEKLKKKKIKSVDIDIEKDW